MEHKLWINGEWVDSQDAGRLEVDRAAPASEIIQNEVFGPALAVSTFSDEAEAVGNYHITKHVMVAHQ